MATQPSPLTGLSTIPLAVDAPASAASPAVPTTPVTAASIKPSEDDANVRKGVDVGIDATTPPMRPPTTTEVVAKTPKPALPQAERHKVFYFPDGSIILRVENTLFKVFLSVMMKASPTVSELFGPMLAETQDRIGMEGEGKSDDHPVLWEGWTALEVEIWFEYIFRFYVDSGVQVEPETDRLMRLLGTTSALLDYNTRRYAKAALEEKALSPIARLRLARMHNIPSWVPGAVRDFFPCVLEKFFTEPEHHRLIKDMRDEFIIITEAWHKIDKYRRAIALWPAGQETQGTIWCDSHDVCKHNWTSMWMKRVAPFILHPSPEPLSKLLSYVSDAKFAPNAVNSLCLEEFQNIVAAQNAGQKEKAAIDDAIRRILRLFADLRDEELIWVDGNEEQLPDGGVSLEIRELMTPAPEVIDMTDDA